jgi:hypothetical protein
MSESAKVRIERDGNPMSDPVIRAKLIATTKTEMWRRNVAEGQARVDRETGRNGLNDRVASFLTILGIEHEREYVLPGSAPYRFDFAWPSIRVLLEVMGCRYHTCPIHPQSHFSDEKCRINQARLDKAKRTYAERHGWTLVYLWEHDVPQNLKHLLNYLSPLPLENGSLERWD